ncbi:hypothetical protein [Martelella sp. AD-3]|uniref:hypothetical protein n=1 Tax=Martelella sp. AD-3 TaxID=686597 RepID=UPI000467B2A6|nr:hypothetical protein [Martelella sp. AD-3]AMM83779.1 hypothetical protein AZF01_04920 [Martelella sp. AD-3]
MANDNYSECSRLRRIEKALLARSDELAAESRKHDAQISDLENKIKQYRPKLLDIISDLGISAHDIIGIAAETIVKRLGGVVTVVYVAMKLRDARDLQKQIESAEGMIEEIKRWKIDIAYRIKDLHSERESYIKDQEALGC